MSAGTLQVGANSAMGTASTSVSVTSGAAVDLNGVNYSTASIMSLNGTGVSSTGALTNSSATAATYGGIVTLNTSSSIGGTGNITLTAGLGADAVTLTKVGTDTLTLNGSSNRTGLVSVSAGTLQVGTNSAMGTVSANVSVTSGAALDLNGVNYTTASPLSINGQLSSTVGALTNSNATAATYAGSGDLGYECEHRRQQRQYHADAGLATDNVTLTKVGSDTLTLNAASNRTGPGLGKCRNLAGRRRRRDGHVGGTTVGVTSGAAWI